MNSGNLFSGGNSTSIVIASVTAAAALGLGLGVIKPQYERLQRVAAQHKSIAAQASHIEDVLSTTDRVNAEFSLASRNLNEAESDISTSGSDLFEWSVLALHKFSAPYQVKFLKFSPGEAPASPPDLASASYHEGLTSVWGKARFHCFGQFLADLENQFPHFRVINISLEPERGNNDESEGLSFKMDLVYLVKHNS